MNEYELKHDQKFMLLKDFREPLLSFELMHFRNSFSYTIENNVSFKHEILSRVGPLGANLIICLPWDAEISRFPKLSIYSKIVLLKTFLQHFELCFYCKYSRR